MEDQIKNSIERALEKKLNHAYMTCSYLPEVREIASEIYAAIKPYLNPSNLDWSKFPDWANWYSVDADGEVTVWEYKPKLISDCFAIVKGRCEWIEYKMELDGTGDYPNWKESLQRRPKC